MSMPHFVQSLAGQLAQPLIDLAAAGFTWACAWGARWLYIHTKNERIRASILRLDDAVNVAVGEMQGTVVATLKANTVDGKLSASAGAAVKSAALNTIESHFGQKGLDELKKVLGVPDLGVVVNSRIEAAVQQAKAATSVVTTSVTETSIPALPGITPPTAT